MKRKHQRQPIYSLIDEIMASATEPLPAAKRMYQVDVMLAGLDDLERGATPRKESWANCADCVNLLETLVVMNEVADERGLLADAVQALAEAGIRNKQGMALRLSGPGIQAVRAVLEDYAEVIAALPARVMIKAYRRTEARLLAIQRGRVQAHDVAIVAL